MGGDEVTSALRGWHDVLLARGLLCVADSLGTAILVLDARGSVVFANPRAAELLGHQRAELERASIDAVLAPLARLVAAARTEGGEGRGTLHALLSSGREIDIGYTLSQLRFEHLKAVHYALAFQDITQLLRVQEERDRLLKLATVGEALPSLLHELKNPLAAIASSVELLIEESSDRHQQADLHAVLAEVRRAALSLDGIGSVGRTAISARLCAIDLAVTEACCILKSRAQRAHVTLSCQVQTMPLLWLDAAVVRAAVFNLVANAIAACNPGAEVSVDARLTDDGQHFLLTVTDVGSGMTADVLARCTELFFTTKRSGSGIGLSLCKQIAEGAGGDLTIESQPGAGTTVRIRIPVPLAPPSHSAETRL